MTLRASMISIGGLLAGGSAVHMFLRLRVLVGPRLWVDRVNVIAGVGAVILIGILVLMMGLRVRSGLVEQIRYLFTHRPKATALTTGIVVAGLLLIAVEGAFELLDRRRSGPKEIQSGSYTTDFFVGDSLLGYGPAHGARATSKKEVDAVTIYDVVYTVDEMGRRVTPPPTIPGGPLVLFFGCSNTFGEGVEDNETLPSSFAALVPSATVLNYGFCGYGPQQMLAMLEDGRLDAVVHDRDVIAIYMYIDAHVSRAVGSMVVTTTWGTDMPYYVMAGQNGLEHHGSFRSGRPVTNCFYALATRYRTFSHLGYDLPLRRESHFELTARIVEQAAAQLRERAASSRFYVILHPHVLTRDELVPHFDGSNVQVLDYLGLYDRKDEDFMIANDWHPTPLAYRTIAAALVRDLGLGTGGMVASSKR
jgi:hypothetical protein